MYVRMYMYRKKIEALYLREYLLYLSFGVWLSLPSGGRYIQQNRKEWKREELAPEKVKQSQEQRNESQNKMGQHLEDENWNDSEYLESQLRGGWGRESLGPSN